MPSDIELMLKAKAGYKVAFDEIIRRYHAPVIAFFQHRLWNRDRAMAEDFAQDVFTRLYEALPNYEPQGEFVSYLYSIARNLWRDHARRLRTRPRSMSLDQTATTSPHPDDAPTLLHQLSADVAPPDANLEREETLRGFQAAVADLPDDLSLMFTLFHIHGKKYDEIATIMNVPLGTVKSRMSSAYERVRQGFLKRRPDMTETLAPSNEPKKSTRRIRVSLDWKSQSKFASAAKNAGDEANSSSTDAPNPPNPSNPSDDASSAEGSSRSRSRSRVEGVGAEVSALGDAETERGTESGQEPRSIGKSNRRRRTKSHQSTAPRRPPSSA